MRRIPAWHSASAFTNGISAASVNDQRSVSSRAALLHDLPNHFEKFVSRQPNLVVCFDKGVSNDAV
jgi:hypothetical protein